MAQALKKTNETALLDMTRDIPCLDQEHDSGHHQIVRRQTVRHCLVSGDRCEKSAMIRFVVDPEGALTPDPTERLPGRGLWLRADRDIVNTAITKNLFAKAARAPVSVPANLMERLEKLLVRRCQERLGMARRAGQAVMGHEKALAWLKRGKAALIVMAVDAGGSAREIGYEKILRCALTGEELGGVFDRDRTVYVAVTNGSLSKKLRMDLDRLAGLRKIPDLPNLTKASDAIDGESIKAHG